MSDFDEAFLNQFPGGELIAKGLDYLKQGEILRPEALLVLIGKPRLRRAGLPIPEVPEQEEYYEIMLYQLLCDHGFSDPYGRYNTLLRRLISFENAVVQHMARVKFRSN